MADYGHDEFGRRLDAGGDPINPDMGEGRWQDAPRRKRAAIRDGVPLNVMDSNEPGDRNTTCSWGMCDDSPEQWPDKDDHIWPQLFAKGRIAPRSMPEGAACPMDKRGPDEDRKWGCFYHCRVFGRDIRVDPDLGRDDRKRSLVLYDKVIAAMEREYGRQTTADDKEPWVK